VQSVEVATPILSIRDRIANYGKALNAEQDSFVSYRHLCSILSEDSCQLDRSPVTGRGSDTSGTTTPLRRAELDPRPGFIPVTAQGYYK
jgi:hypothetical protein